LADIAARPDYDPAVLSPKHTAQRPILAGWSDIHRCHYAFSVRTQNAKTHERLGLAVPVFGEQTKTGPVGSDCNRSHEARTASWRDEKRLRDLDPASIQHGQPESSRPRTA